MKKIYQKNWEQNAINNQIPEVEELLSLLKSDDFEDKHFALTYIDTLPEASDILAFIENLVDNDTKIRELSSFRLINFILENPNYMSFLDENEDIILRAICDVNPQVCRNICTILHLSKKKNILQNKIIEKISILIEKTKNIKNKSHKVSKDIFNLYWNFMALENLIEKPCTNPDMLLSLISQSLEYKDYTIRERGAYLFKKTEIKNEEIFSKIQKDVNFYVKNVFLVK